jgi:hypothetical protein
MIINDENKILVKIKSFRESWFMEKFNKANKKLAKLNEEIKIISRKERIEEYKIKDNWTGEIITTTQKYIDLEISKPEITKRQNTEYVGCVNWKDGLTVFNTKQDEYVLAEQEKRCDHCKINRQRNKYFFFLEDGELKSIGSSCVNQYFGYNLITILTIWDDVIDIRMNDEDGYCGSYGPQERDLHYIANIVDYVTFIQKGHWKKGAIWEMLNILEIKDCYANDCDKKTKRDFRDYLHNRKEKVDGNSFYKNIINKLVEEFKEKELKNDFDYSIDNALFEIVNNEKVIKSWINLKQIGIVSYVIYKVINPDKKVNKKEEKKESNFVGEIGKRIELKLNVIYTTVIESYYGNSLLVKFIDDNGNLFTWFNSGNSWNAYEIGRELKVKATIKKHETYNNEKVTYLNRVKSLNKK